MTPAPLGRLARLVRRSHDPAPVGRAGWRIVAAKEFTDHVRSARFLILLLILGLTAAGGVAAAAGSIRDAAQEASGSPALFLRLFTVAPERLPPFFLVVGFLAPLLGIAFGFDAVNGERAQGTLPRLLSQPLHRDDVVNGKFAAGLTVIGLILVSVTGLIAGIGLLGLGVVPDADEAGRIVLWLAVAVIYVAFWLALATLCSVALRRAATSALVAIAAWLVATLFVAMLVGVLADALAPVGADTAADQLRNAQLQQSLARMSPTTLYQEATGAILNPAVRTTGLLLPVQTDQALPSMLPVGQTMLLVWPQVVGLIALTAVCFAVAYVVFMRQEVRA